MRKNKFIRLLSTLSLEEFKRFWDFVASPYFNKNKKCVELVEALLPFAPSFDDEHFNLESLLHAIYKNKNSIKTLLRDSVRLLEKFLAQEELHKEPFYEHYLILKQLEERKEVMHFLVVYKRSIKQFNELNSKSLLDIYHQFLVATTYFDYQFSTSNTSDLGYEQLFQHLDTSYLANRLKYSSSMVNLQRLKTGEKIIPSENAMLQLASEKRLVDNKVVLLYKTAYLLIVENTEERFSQLKGLLGAHLTLLPKEEASSIYTVAINFCARSLAAGKVEYYAQLFDLYKQCIEQQLFVVNGRLSFMRVFNTVIVGVKTKNFTWVEHFLDTNKIFIEESFQEVVYYYCKGYLYHGQGQLSKASEALLQANAESYPQNTSQYTMVKFLKFNIQILLLKIYYEKEELLAFESLVKSFSERLRLTKGIDKKEIKGYHNFLSMANTLFRFKTDPNYKKSINIIRTKLDGMELISDKQWLLRKIDEL